MITVFIEGLEFYGFHGVPEAERTVGHRYRVDIFMEVESTAEQTDRVEDTADYGRIGLELTRLGENQQHLTIERLAREMAEHILRNFLQVSEVNITVRKLLPPAPVIAAASGVTLKLKR
jgi:dihydroneopterin aldolase